MDLDNPLDVVVHYLIIGGMIGLSHQDNFPMVSTLVCMVTYWTKLTMSHNIGLSSSHNFTKLLHSIVSQPWEDNEFVPKFVVTLTYEWDFKVITYSYGLGHC